MSAAASPSSRAPKKDEATGSHISDAVADTPVVPAPRTYGEGTVALTRLKALDGIRGIAMGAVLSFHLDQFLGARPGATHWFQHMSGAVVGLDLFFVLSGALITSLLLAEHHQTGTISLRQFYLRRLRRLAPALLIALTLAVIWEVVGIDPGLGNHQRRVITVIAVLLFVANWDENRHGGLGVISPAWSLGVEEQFYLTWPGILRGLLRDRANTKLVILTLLLTMMAFVGITSFISHALGSTAAYYASFSGGIGLLLGAALGILLVQHPTTPIFRPLRTEFMGLAAFAGLFALGATVQGSIHRREAFNFRYGGLNYLLIDVVAAALVAHIFLRGHQPSLLTRFLSWPPFVGLGVISYGVYLYHVPVITLFIQLFPHTSASWLMVITPFDSVLVAVLSYFFIERPIRRGGRSRKGARAGKSVDSGGPGEIEKTLGDVAR